MSILEDLYCGRIAPHEHRIEPESEYENLLRYIIDHEDDLKSTLTEQQKETFEKYKDCRAEVESLTEVEAFISGFKLATKIMMEVVQSDEQVHIKD